MEDRSASGLSTDLWGETVLTAAYARNRIWQKRSGETLHGLFTGQKPDYRASCGGHQPTHMSLVSFVQANFAAHRQVAFLLAIHLLYAIDIARMLLDFHLACKLTPTVQSLPCYRHQLSRVPITWTLSQPTLSRQGLNHSNFHDNYRQAC